MHYSDWNRGINQFSGIREKSTPNTDSKQEMVDVYIFGSVYRVSKTFQQQYNQQIYYQGAHQHIR